MKIRVSQWSVSRKKIRPSFSLGALGMLFSVSDRVSGPKLSEQDRLDTAYPYRLELMSAAEAPGALVAGRYRLNLAETDACARVWAEDLAGRIWRTQSGHTSNVKGKSGAVQNRLVTDLTEYERMIWEELAAGEPPTLNFELLD